MSVEALQIAEKRRKVKGKGERERYIQLNAEIQKRARKDKKVFLSKQCQEIEEKNRKGKTKDLFKKIGKTKGIFHAKMGIIKDRNFMGLTEVVSGSSAFSKTSLNIWKFMVHVLLKPGLENFEHHFTSI